ncbi:membrane protein implicated in regulation of membrane protease activity [Agrobacterium vitis]|nr:membrane protein implicated in regulation of membrane protease activity [Agrobacterium vitis]MBE1438142.1 membrane protein implicated in regulation of membrane protease activity [Agrobacterium vitis]
MLRILFFLLLIGVGYWYYRRFTRDAEKLVRRNRQKERERETGAIATLVKDPKTGEYRIKEED